MLQNKGLCRLSLAREPDQHECVHALDHVPDVPPQVVLPASPPYLDQQAYYQHLGQVELQHPNLEVAF
jgi:hypothetical protein